MDSKSILDELLGIIEENKDQMPIDTKPKNKIEIEDDYPIEISEENLNDYQTNNIIEDLEEISLEDALNDDKGDMVVEDSISISDALIASLRNLGRVDIEYIAMCAKVKKEDVIIKLRGSIYQDPTRFNGRYDQGFVTSDEFLSGNLLIKLNEAKKANQKYPGRFSDNINILERVLPKEISFNEIYYSLASPWLPLDIINQFIIDLGKRYQNTFQTDLKVEKNPLTGLYIVPNQILPYSANLRLGTYRIYATSIIQHLLNMSPITLYKDNDGRKQIDKDDTFEALKQAQAIKDEFKQFVETNILIKEKIKQIYMEKFAYITPRIYDGSYLEFPNMNQNIRLYPYQKNAVARIIFNHNTLLAHNVGTGKTYIMIAAGEELLRLKMSKKNLYVLPNNILSQWYNLYKTLYPNREILVVNNKNFSPQKRIETLKQIKENNYQVILMTYSAFDMIDMSKKYQIKALEKEIDEIKAIDTSKSYNLKNKVEKEIEKKEEAIEELKNSPYCRFEAYSFDKLGISRLFVDEAHNYKNITLHSSMQRIKGLSLNGSIKCNLMLRKVDYLNGQKNSGIIMATGTPITNSISDIYTFQRYLQYGELELLNIPRFDNWLAMFTEEAEDLEVDIDTATFRITNRLSKFHNLPELTSILAMISDFYQSQTGDDLPKFNGYIDTMIHKSTELKDYLKEISVRVDLIRNGKIKRNDDNMLKVTTDGRKAALDLRLVDYNRYQYATPYKILALVSNVLDIYNATNNFKGTQVIFSDVSTPNDKFFNVYDQVKHYLVARGIPEKEIAYVHEANTDLRREKLFANFNSGKIRILIGSTFKLGLGVNIQERLYAIHHLDIPWRPADMVQREGRIIRPGNLNKEVFIYRYIAESSFDAYSWQLLEIKQKFINDLLANALNERSKDDVDNTVLSYAEAKALSIGNNLLKERFTISNQISKYRLLIRKKRERIIYLERMKIEIPERLKEIDELIDQYECDIKTYKDNYYELNKEEKEELRDKLFALNDYIEKDEEYYLGDYFGFKIIFPAKMTEISQFIYLEGKGRYRVDKVSEAGFLQKIDNSLARLDSCLESLKEKKASLESSIYSIDNELGQQTDYESIIGELQKKLEKIDKELNKEEK